MKRLLIIPLLLTACGPISAEKAADICEERARAATGPTGEIGVGIDNKGKTKGFFSGLGKGGVLIAAGIAVFALKRKNA